MSEIVGQDHITTTLENALKKGAISHAYLFTGPRGVGKTSIARILAHEVNGLPYDEDATHLDIIEIDAASNRRIDEIRTLRERVHNAPTSAKYKVYIIDEVHMLTKEAFNALLKTLEEPPAHAIFILATTEAHKLPETIISRTQRFTFKPVERNAAVAHLRHIADEEGIEISDEALELLAEHGGGSFRDSISLLDQISNTGAVVDLAAAQRMLGIAPHTAIRELIQLLASGETKALLEALRQLHEQGYQAPQIAKQLARELRSDLLANAAPLEPLVISKLLHRLIDVPAAHDPHALLEIILLEVVLSRQTQEENQESRIKNQGSPSKEPIDEPTTKPSRSEVVKIKEPSPVAEKLPLDEAAWQQTLQSIRQKYNTLYGVARMATPLFENNKLTLCFSFPFHQKRMNDAKNKQIVAEVMEKQLGYTVEILCIVDEKPVITPQKPTENPESPATAQSDNPIETISNIFGNAELLE